MRVRSVTAPDMRIDHHPHAPPAPAPSPFSSHSFPFLAHDLPVPAAAAASTAPYTFGAPQFDRSPARRAPHGFGHGYAHSKVSRKSNHESRQRRGLAKLLVHDAAKNSRKSGHMSCEGCRVRKLRCSRQRNCLACVERGEPCVWKGGRPVSGLTPIDIRNGIVSAKRELARLERLARLLAARYVKREAVLAHAEDREPRRPPSIEDVIEAERVDVAANEGRALEEAEALLSLATPTVGRAGDEVRGAREEEAEYGGGMGDILVDDLFVDDERPPSSSRADNFRHAGRTSSSSSSRPKAHRSSTTSHTHGATFIPRLRVTIPHSSSSSSSAGRTGPLSSGARSLLQQTPHAPSPLRYPPLVAQSSASPPPPPAQALGPAATGSPSRSSAPADGPDVAPSGAPPAHPSFPLAPPPSTTATPPEPGPTYFYPALPPPLMSPSTAAHLAATRIAALAARDDPAVLEARKSAHEKRWEGAVRRLEERRRRELRGEKGDEEEGKGREEVERVAREWGRGQRGEKVDGEEKMDVDGAPADGGTTSTDLVAAKDGPSAPVPQRSLGTLSLAAKDLVASAINRQQALCPPLSSSTSPSNPSSSSSFPALSHRPILSLDAQGAFSASALHHHSLLRTPSAHLGHDHHRPHTPSRISPSSNSASATPSTLLLGSRITLSPLRSAAPHLSAVEEGLRPINSLLGALAAGALGGDERFEPRTERARGLLLGALDDEGEGARDAWDRFEPQLEERVEQAARMEVDSPPRDGGEVGTGAGCGSDAETETDGRSSVGRVSRRSARSAAELEEEEEEDEDESQSGESQSGESDDGSD
ncbi:hypothetical protein JCM8208_004667 [Rhodotorula glutinis]